MYFYGFKLQNLYQIEELMSLNSKALPNQGTITNCPLNLSLKIKAEQLAQAWLKYKL